MLGAGGMGEVYLAHDMRLNRKVALKVLPPASINNSEGLHRFEQEAQAASALNHPNIITIHEIGEENGTNFIAIEFIEGETLRQKLQSERLEIEETLNIATQIAAALDAAHKSGIVHRDIKPENIMMREDGLVKVLDFGLAKLTEKKEITLANTQDPTRALVRTTPGAVMGTVAYMSPEQARGLPVDVRTDIFSLGIVLYEMLAGRLPFEGATASDMIAAILKAEPAMLDATTPLELQRIVSKSLQKNVDERYQTVKDLLIDLRQLNKRLEMDAEIERTALSNQNEAKPQTINVTTTDATHSTSSAEFVVSEIKQHKLGFVFGLIILLTGLAGLGYWLYRQRSDLTEAQQINSVAVLPFSNDSGDANLDYLSDGMSESLIDKLSQLPQLKVIARNSSFKYRGENIDIQDVANKLGVQAIVMGKIVRRGDDLTIRVEMVDARDNKQIWGETFSRKLIDSLRVQEEIAQIVTGKLRLKLSGAQEQLLAKVDTVNAQAYELLLKGRYYANIPGMGNLNKAVEYFNQAIAVDPNYALAYAELSRIYRLQLGNSLVDPKEVMPKSEAAARKALELDGNLAEAHLAMAGLHRDAWNWAAAEAEYKRAIELNPNLGGARLGYAAYLSMVERHDESIAEARRGKELDPLTLRSSTQIALSFHFARRYDEEIEAARKILDLHKVWGHNLLGYAYAGKGMYKEAAANHEESIRAGNPSPSAKIYLGAAYAQAGEREKARVILKNLETSKEYVSPAELAILYVALGDKEAALQSLEKGFMEHDLQLQYLKVETGLDPLRSDQRFQDLLRRVGFSQ